MSKNIIGLKQADGTFYPILTRGKPAKKRLQITTASDNQTAAQITLFCASDESFSDAEYVDTLMIEGLKPHEKRSVDLDFIITLDENDELSAQVYDQESGGSTNSAVSLVTIGASSSNAEETMDIAEDPVGFSSEQPDLSDDIFSLSDLDDFQPEPENSTDETPVTATENLSDEDLNFDIDDPSLFAATGVDDDAFADDSFADETYEEIAETTEAEPQDSMFADDDNMFDEPASQEDAEVPDLFGEPAPSGGFADFDFLDPNAGKAKLPLVPIICIICALISVLSCLGIWLWFSKNKQQQMPLVVEKAPAVKYQSVTVVTEKAEPVDAALIDRINSSTTAKEDSIIIIDAPVVVPTVTSKTASVKDTKDYQIKWGDTLWDIADTFYKNPWMYEKIARANNIKNPDFILSGTWIKIPPL